MTPNRIAKRTCFVNADIVEDLFESVLVRIWFRVSIALNVLCYINQKLTPRLIRKNSILDVGCATYGLWYQQCSEFQMRLACSSNCETD